MQSTMHRGGGRGPEGLVASMLKWSVRGQTLAEEDHVGGLLWGYSLEVTDRRTYRTEGWSFWSDWSGWTDTETESRVGWFTVSNTESQGQEGHSWKETAQRRPGREDQLNRMFIKVEKRERIRAQRKTGELSAQDVRVDPHRAADRATQILFHAACLLSLSLFSIFGIHIPKGQCFPQLFQTQSADRVNVSTKELYF